MATQTPNYNLEKPDSTDAFSLFRGQFNYNMDIIDANLGGGGGGSTVTYTPTLVSGTQTGTISINGVSTNMYAPTPPTDVSELNNDSGYLTSSDVATVAISGDYDDLLNKPTIPTNVSDLNNDTGFTVVSWNQIQNSGTKIAEITIDGTQTDVYAPSGGGGGGSVNDVLVNGVSVVDGNGDAQITSYKEVTQVQYDALPSSKLTDGVAYFIKDALTPNQYLTVINGAVNIIFDDGN